MYSCIDGKRRLCLFLMYFLFWIFCGSSKIEGSQATARHTAELLRSVISQQRVSYTNQAGALIDAVRAVGEQLIAANPVGMCMDNLFIMTRNYVVVYFIEGTSSINEDHVM
jgi:translation initiation factor 2B subunit (eIF-2B alpha/beta/delta family)